MADPILEGTSQDAAGNPTGLIVGASYFFELPATWSTRETVRKWGKVGDYYEKGQFYLVDFGSFSRVFQPSGSGAGQSYSQNKGEVSR